MGRALALRAALQDVYEASTQQGPELLKRWCRWATRSRLAPFKKLAQTFRQYWDGIVSYFQCRITQGAIECEIGDLLRHRRPDATAIYAKVQPANDLFPFPLQIGSFHAALQFLLEH